MIKKLLLISFILSGIFHSCGTNKQTQLVNKVFVYQNGNASQTVAFDEKKIYIKWSDSLGNDSFTSDYTFQQVNDTVININTADTIKYLGSKTWKISMKDNTGFSSSESGKFYQAIEKKTDSK